MVKKRSRRDFFSGYRQNDFPQLDEESRFVYYLKSPEGDFLPVFHLPIKYENNLRIFRQNVTLY